MSYPINYPTPQGANIQIFGGNGSGIGDPLSGSPVYQITTREWVKPAGCSFVWFTLIGAGGGGANPLGGGSGAVTNFMCPAFLIPDVLQVNVGNGGGYGRAGSATTIVYQSNDSVGYTLLTALAGDVNQLGGAASSSNFFTAMGFFQSIAGQDGSTTLSASPTTFLSGGIYSGSLTPNYGYPIAGGGINTDGFFQMQPIIVGRGSAETGKGGIGCGGGGSNFAASQNGGGDGLAVIISW